MMDIHALSMVLCSELVFETGICERLDVCFGIRSNTWFHEGISLELYCRQDTRDDIKVESFNKGTIVEGSHLVDGMTDKYDFQKNSSGSVFAIKRLSRMVQISAMLIFLPLVLVFGSGICERLFFHSGLENAEWFPEGISLELYCRQDTINDVEISSPTATIVQGSHLLPGMTNRYAFYKNSSFSILVIKQISRRDQGIFTCQEGFKRNFAVIRVLYSPSDKSPQCSSYYESAVIYDDMRQDYINFTCTTNEGNPPVLMTLTVHGSDHFGNITDIAKRCAVYQNFINSRSFSCHIDKSLNNTTFLCNVTQQFPSPYTGSYQGSCSFGPLHFLSNFSITINEFDVTVQEGEDVNLTCTTNVIGVEIMWSGIPVDWEYNVTKNDYFSHVWMKNMKHQSPSKITVQCIGFYGHRNMTDSVTLIIFGKLKHPDIFLSSLIVTIFILTFSIVGVSVICFRCRQNQGEIDDNRAVSNKSQSTYTTTVMATDESVENELDALHGSPAEYDHSIFRASPRDNNPDTKYYDIPLQSKKNYLDDGGYLVPSSSHPRPPLYQHIA